MRKFHTLIEQVLGNRQQHGGFRVGDVVKIKESKIGSIPNAPDSYKALLKEVASSTLNLRVLGVHPKTMVDGIHMTGLPESYVIDVGQEYASGMFNNRFTVSPDMLEIAEWRVPNEWKGKRYNERNSVIRRLDSPRVAKDGSEKLNNGTESSTTGRF